MKSGSRKRRLAAILGGVLLAPGILCAADKKTPHKLEKFKETEYGPVLLQERRDATAGTFHDVYLRNSGAADLIHEVLWELCPHKSHIGIWFSECPEPMTRDGIDGYLDAFRKKGLIENEEEEAVIINFLVALLPANTRDIHEFPNIWSVEDEPRRRGEKTPPGKRKRRFEGMNVDIKDYFAVIRRAVRTVKPKSKAKP
ncbi:hypothetical protein ACFL2T_01925 [Elusimicrobiota bacterium]